MNIRLISVLLTILFGASAAFAADTELRKWTAMQEDVASARDILSGEVTNGFNPVGQVRDLVLSPDGKRVQYILYEVPFPYSFYAGEDGFVTFDNVALERGARLDVEVRFEGEANKTPEQLELTASQADHRLVERLLNDPIVFVSEDYEARILQDILINRDTGRITHYVIELNPDSLFNENPRAVPAEVVSIDEEGNLTASVPISRIDQMQTYEVGML